jgi:hypothetical protein
LREPFLKRAKGLSGHSGELEEKDFKKKESHHRGCGANHDYFMQRGLFVIHFILLYNVKISKNLSSATRHCQGHGKNTMNGDVFLLSGQIIHTLA